MNRFAVIRFALAAVLVGLVAGVAVAVSVPETESKPKPGALRVAPADARLIAATDVRLRVHRRSLRTALRRADPHGGPGWVVRTFLAEQVLRPAGRRDGADPVLERNRCAQLGRIVDGRFGWVDGSNVFRPVGTQRLGAPIYCGPRRADMHGEPGFEAATLVSADGPDARLLLTFAWGIGGRATDDVALRLGDRTVAVQPGPEGVFLEFADPHVSSAQVRARFSYPGAKAVTTMGLPVELPGLEDLRGPDPDAVPQIDARAPDPNGGPAWGVGSVPAKDGSLCQVEPGRIAGDRTGRLDFTLDTLKDPLNFLCRGPDAALTRDRPLQVVGTSGQEELAEGGDPQAGRLARRTLPGLSVIYGTAHPDVATVTFVTPRGIRTVAPAGRTHAFLAVYDGTFPAGEVEVIAEFADGTSKTLPVFGLG
jgi:hypothetical protein